MLATQTKWTNKRKEEHHNNKYTQLNINFLVLQAESGMGYSRKKTNRGEVGGLDCWRAYFFEKPLEFLGLLTLSPGNSRQNKTKLHPPPPQKLHK